MICDRTSQHFSDHLGREICCAYKTTATGYTTESAAAAEALTEVGNKLMGSNFDPPSSFPSKSFSKSHSAGKAWAAGSTAQLGIGIDIEHLRPVDSAIHRFIIDIKIEQPWLTGSSDSSMLFKIWTAKEALFKSDLENKGKVLSQYVVESLPTKSKPGFAHSGMKQYAFQTLSDSSTVLTVAVPIRGNSEYC